MKDDPEQAQALVHTLLAGMLEDDPASLENDPLVQVYHSVWQRVAKASWTLHLTFIHDANASIVEFTARYDPTILERLDYC